MKDTQAARLLAWLRAHPGTSAYEITVALYIVNSTGRISDLRDKGHDIEAVRDAAGVWRYWLKEAQPIAAGQVPLW